MSTHIRRSRRENRGIRTSDKFGNLVSATKSYGISTRSQSKIIAGKKKINGRVKTLRSYNYNLSGYEQKINKILKIFCNTFNQAPNDEYKRQMHFKVLAPLSSILSQKCELLKDETDYFEINHELLNIMNEYLEENIKLPEFYDTIHSYFISNKIIKDIFPNVKNIPNTNQVWNLRLLVLKKIFEFEQSFTKENFENFY
jgi:hypothetical protein